MEKINHFKKKYIYALPIILLFAFLFRLWTIPSGPLSFDENKYYNRALKTATFEKIDVFGHEIYGKQGSSFTWGGSFIYLFSIPLFFVQTPIAVKVFLALLSTLLIYGLYHLIRRYYSEDTAIYTSLFFAFSPWTIFSSTLIFHNVIILFIVPLLFLFLKGFNDNKRLLIAFIPTVIFMCFSVHATSVALGITAIISYFIYKPKLNLKLILWAFIILLLAMLPTIIYEITTDFSNVKLFIARTAHRDAPYKPETFKIFQWLVTVPSSEIGFLIGRSRDKFISFFKFPYFLFFIPAIIFSIYLVIASYWITIKKVIKKSDNYKNILLLYAFIIGYLVFHLSNGEGGEPRYIFALFPILFIILGEGINFLVNKYGKRILYPVLYTLVIHIVMFVRLMLF